MMYRVLFAIGLFSVGQLAVEAVSPRVVVADEPVSEEDAFLDDLQRRTLQFFLDEQHPVTGLIPDRAKADGTGGGKIASIAGTGFGLSAYCIGVERGWLSREEGASRVKRTLLHFRDYAEHERGFFYHFLNMEDGTRAWKCEASSIDTTILLTGAIVAAEYFSDHPEIRDLTNTIYRRIDWNWMLNGNRLLNMGWHPETGFIQAEWRHYCELMMLVLLAIGADEHEIEPVCWLEWQRQPVLHFEGREFISYPPLFVHQYSHAFYDFRGKRDPVQGRSWFENSRIATLAQIAFQKELAKRDPGQFGRYGDDLWGLTSSDSEPGYIDWGGPYVDGLYEPERRIDGSVVPSASAGSLPFTPQQSLRTLRYQKSCFGDRVYKKYGFVNAFTPRTDWFDPEVISIDTGITIIMAENYRSGFVWKQFMKNANVRRSLELVRFTGLAE